MQSRFKKKKNTFYLQKDGLSAKPFVLVRDDLTLYQTCLVGH